ncbi:ABC transporter [Anaerobacillus alkalilacustris]|uniref:ABC transporter n=1 Tax=Anaerobacillus alkalilacustris TaxID=393763 RepID=A0A1S2LHB9_9BACI|nr:ABC transporter ATP-binding protein [Anaerobacillus alkalilacustris]OIJ11463.1 ABC transporter [Anaerobacillus alkalilacustris]
MEFNVKVSNVVMRYKDFVALKGVSFTLEQGKVYGLLGRNGAGKTTLLSLLASFIEPTSGTILIGGENPFENSKIMPHVCFIYNTNYKDEDETVMSYFEFAERYRPNFDRDYAKQLATKFKLPLNKPLNKLSNGMQSAFNVTLGLATRSQVTIFDEAYLGMDAPTRELFYQEVLEEQVRQPRIMILSTHLVSEMEYLFDHVLIVNHGHLIIDEPYDEFISRGASVTGEASEVEKFVKGMKQLSMQQLGRTKSVMTYGEINDDAQKEARKLGLEIGPVSLHDLFIHLTKEEEHYETKR